MSSNKKEEILEAASECFVDYGYDKTTMSDIGRKVGLNKASLYYHFKDKSALFSAMVEKKRASHLSRQEALLSKEENSNKRIISFITGEISFIEELAVNFLDNHSVKNENNAVFDELIRYDFEKLIELLLSSGKEYSLPVEKMAELLLQTSKGLLLADCPLDMPRNDRKEGYSRVKSRIEKVVAFILRGAIE